MKTILILATHGAPPRDFPGREMGEFFSLHAQAETSPRGLSPEQQARYAELDQRMRAWPRTPHNDPFHASSLDMAARLSAESGLETLVCFNEFCGPSLDEALAQAAQGGAGRILVATPMMTSGGDHAGQEIPQAIARARSLYPHIEMIYAWPFDPADVARFLAAQVTRFIPAS